MENRELNQVAGGVNCCICGCDQGSGTLANGNANNAINWDLDAGYGSGAFA